MRKMRQDPRAFYRVLSTNSCQRTALDRVEGLHARRALPAHAWAASTLRTVDPRICPRPLSGGRTAQGRREPRELHRHDRALHAVARHTAATPGKSTPSTHPPKTTLPRGSLPRGGLTRCRQREGLDGWPTSRTAKHGWIASSLLCGAAISKEDRQRHPRTVSSARSVASLSTVRG